MKACSDKLKESIFVCISVLAGSVRSPSAKISKPEGKKGKREGAKKSHQNQRSNGKHFQLHVGATDRQENKRRLTGFYGI